MSDESRRADGHKMDVDPKSPELKIRGQAEAEKRKSKWDEQDKDEVRHAEHMRFVTSSYTVEAHG